MAEFNKNKSYNKKGYNSVSKNSNRTTSNNYRKSNNRVTKSEDEDKTYNDYNLEYKKDRRDYKKNFDTKFKSQNRTEKRKKVEMDKKKEYTKNKVTNKKVNKQINNKESKQEYIAPDYEEFYEKEIYDDQIEGRNSVIELLESGKDINKIFITKGDKHGSIYKIIAMAKEKKVILVEKDKFQMQKLAQTDNHQGVIAVVPPFEYSEIEDILENAKSKNEDPFVLILDGIEDPHNLGSIIRTAETAGVHGIIIPKRRAAMVNSTVNKVSAGAAQYMKIARVTNITEAIETLKEKGLWICGTDINTDKYYYNQDLKGAIGIVIGNEGNGISDKVKKNCDFLVKIPMKGNITSLNASVSTGIVVYEVVKQRL